MSLLAVLIGLAWPSFAGLRRGYAFETAAQELVDCMSFARAAAIADGVPYKMAFDPESRIVKTFKLDPQNGLIAAPRHCGRGQRIEGKMELAGMSDPVLFYPNGTSTSATLALRDGGEQMSIELQGALGYAAINR